MAIRISTSFLQPMLPNRAAALGASLQPLLHRLQTAGVLQTDDVIACEGMHFRVARRVWHGEDDAMVLEVMLQCESWAHLAPGALRAAA
ncbi:MAG: hypothetical protein QM740_02835 [Acidovorax sp.]